MNRIISFGEGMKRLIILRLFHNSRSGKRNKLIPWSLL